jgi:hypothetical protein
MSNNRGCASFGEGQGDEMQKVRGANTEAIVRPPSNAWTCGTGNAKNWWSPKNLF